MLKVTPRLAAWLCAALRLVRAGPASAQNAAGDWQGTRATGQSMAFRLAVHIRKTPNGSAGTKLRTLVPPAPAPQEAVADRHRHAHDHHHHDGEDQGLV